MSIAGWLSRQLSVYLWRRQKRSLLRLSQSLRAPEQSHRLFLQRVHTTNNNDTLLYTINAEYTIHFHQETVKMWSNFALKLQRREVFDEVRMTTGCFCSKRAEIFWQIPELKLAKSDDGISARNLLWQSAPRKGRETSSPRQHTHYKPKTFNVQTGQAVSLCS